MKQYKRWGIITIIVVALLTTFFISKLPGLEFEYNFETIFPEDDPDLAFYQEYRDKFGKDSNYMLVAVPTQGPFFDSTYLAKIEKLTKASESLPYVIDAQSITKVRYPLVNPLGIIRLPYVHPYRPGQYVQDSARIINSPYFGALVDKQFTSAVVALATEPGITKLASEELYKSLDSTLTTLQIKDAHMAGKAIAELTFIDLMGKELAIFMSISAIMVIVLLAISFRSLYTVVVPISIVFITIIWLLGVMVLFNIHISIISTMMPTIIFVVGMSDAVHIISKYIEELRNNTPKADAIKVTVREVGMATFLTSLTTAIGFLTLLTASIQPIREFGVLTATGVMFAFALSFLLIPAVLVIFPPPKVVIQQSFKTQWQNILNTSLQRTFRNRKTVLLTFGLLTILGAIGMGFIQVNAFLIDGIPRDNKLKSDYLYFDQKFGGSRPFEMAIWVGENTGKSLLDWETIQQVVQIEDYLENEYGVEGVSSLLTLIRQVNQATHGGVSSYYQLPDDAESYENISPYIKRILATGKAGNLIDSPQNMLRMAGKIPDWGSAKTGKKNQALRNELPEVINADWFNYRVTGSTLLIDKNHQLLADNMLEGLIIALALIAIIIGVLFKSFRMVVITLLVNVIPLLFIAGIMGFSGIDLKVSTSIIFTIIFGIAVDDTIHFISKFRIEQDKGKSILYAIKRTHLSTGKAIIITTIIIAGGFVSLIFSSFGGTFYTGLLISLTLMLALIIDLTLLPVLLLIRPKKK